MPVGAQASGVNEQRPWLFLVNGSSGRMRVSRTCGSSIPSLYRSKVGSKSLYQIGSQYKFQTKLAETRADSKRDFVANLFNPFS